MSNPAQGAVGAETMTGNPQPVTILYTNWRGETAVQRILIDAIAYGNEALGLVYGRNEWHPEEQWLLSATDADKGERRTFALSGIKAWGQAAVDAALASPRADSDERTAGEDWAATLARSILSREGYAYTHLIEAVATELRRIEAVGYTRGHEAGTAYRKATPAQPAGAVPDSLRALIEAFRHVDQQDWDFLYGRLGDGGQGRFWKAVFGEARPLLASHPAGQSETGHERCEICDKPLIAGQRAMQDVELGTVHAACCGPEREAYVKDVETGEPLGPNDPIPQGYVYHPGGQSAGPGAEAITLTGDPGNRMAPWFLDAEDEKEVEKLMQRPAGDVARLFFPTPVKVQDPIRGTHHVGDAPRQQRLLAAVLQRMILAAQPAPDSTRTGQGEAEGCPIGCPPGECEWPVCGCARIVTSTSKQPWPAGDDVAARLLIDAAGCEDLAPRASIERRFREAFAEAAISYRAGAKRIRELEAALAASPAAPEAQGAWRPISTAPKDGTKLMLCVAGYEPCIGGWFEKRWLSFDPESFDHDTLTRWLDDTTYEPTHWRPVPAPPASSGQGGR